MSDQKNKPIIVTGLSGAGISSVLKTLEDFGFEVFDNFPLSLVGALLTDPQGGKRQVAIGIDTRARGFSAQSLLEICEKEKAVLLFITCEHTALQKRFTDTRRRHPLGDHHTIRESIEKEEKLLQPLRKRADFTIDTTEMSIHDLRHVLQGHFEIDAQKLLQINLMSFAYRHGVPREADIVMDARFLRNPHWDDALRPKTGRDEDIGDYIAADPEFENFMDNFKAMLKPLIPCYAEAGKSYLTIAAGCTGGRHRSVYIIESLSKWLKSEKIAFHKIHRDLKK